MKPGTLHTQLLKGRGNHANRMRRRVAPTKSPELFSSSSCVPTAERRDLPVENTHGNSQTHMVETPIHAALRIGGSFAVPLMRAVAASSRSSPQIREISKFTTAPMPVSILSMNSMATTLKIQVSKKFLAETMTTPPEGR